MKADAKGFKFLSMEGKVKIPFFQRTYVWSEENWEELVNELLNDDLKNNFLGAIILKQLTSASGEPKQLEVIDGQQRLTTLSILLKALYDSLSDENKKNCEGDIYGILRFKMDYTSSNYEIRIEHSYVDKRAFEDVINGNVNSDLIDSRSHLILRCYKYFIEKIKSLDQQKINLLLNKILNPENKMLVVIDLQENDDEQSIFDTLNTAGVRLTVAEIIKNSIFKKAIELLGKDNAVKVYNNTWQETFLANDDTLTYWGTERTTGRIKRDNIEILLHCIGVIKGFYDPDKHTLSDLSKLYKEQINRINSVNELTDLINEIIDYAKIYKEKIITFDKSDLFSFDDSFRRLLHILDELEISTFHPFLLYILKNYSNEDDLISIFNKLEKFLIRNMIARMENTKNYNKLCKQFIDDLKNLEQKLNSIPWSKVTYGFFNISNRASTLLLFWLELYRRTNDDNYDEKELKYDYTLEHIMPIKWEKNWNFSHVPHPNKSLSQSEKERDRNEKIEWIGNKTLLKSKLNTAISNNKFSIKINGDQRKRGIKDYATLSITRKDIINPYENGEKIWNESNIEKRTKNIIDEMEKIWGN